MATIQTSFERYEKKYCLTAAQRDFLLARMQPHMAADRYGRYTINNIYYDTPDWQLIRASIEKPVYKEKLRVRSYGVPGPEGNVFVELKKKYMGVVYKRRVTMTPGQVEPFLAGALPGNAFGQIGREIRWFQSFHRTQPQAYIGYDRETYAGIENPDLRITFDTRLRWRDTRLDLRQGEDGSPIPLPGQILMEIKIPGVCPLWLSHALSEAEAFPTSFSKYGACFCGAILPAMQSRQSREENECA